MDRALRKRLVNEAVELQQRNRLRPFADIPEFILGEAITDMTLRKRAWLELAQNPFVCELPRMPDEIGMAAAAIKLLWICSRDYAPCTSRAARRAMRRFEKRLLKFRPETLIEAARKFAADTFMEAGGFEDAETPARREIPRCCTAAYYVALLAGEFGWSEAEILDMPMRRIFQYANQIYMRRDPEYIPPLLAVHIQTKMLNRKAENGQG